ncbi:hypothetical protein DFH11DRAFT_1727488 [Phellopilus nigrolimitatus]|nr:hypothetical protein DFH11DRAFT_1727488 [Phellopilus nigrolimitatus]
MADAGFFKGTSTDQDRRFSDKESKLLKTLKFPPEFSEKVDMRKVNLQVMRPWIASKVTELVGFEDEVVVEYAMGLLEDRSQPTPDPRKMQINLTGFLTAKTSEFMTSLWKLLLEAQASTGGIPRTFVEEKKEEMRRRRKETERVVVVGVAEEAAEDEGEVEDLTSKDRAEDETMAGELVAEGSYTFPLANPISTTRTSAFPIPAVPSRWALPKSSLSAAFAIPYPNLRRGRYALGLALTALLHAGAVRARRPTRLPHAVVHLRLVEALGLAAADVTAGAHLQGAARGSSISSISSRSRSYSPPPKGQRGTSSRSRSRTPPRRGGRRRDDSGERSRSVSIDRRRRVRSETRSMTPTSLNRDKDRMDVDATPRDELKIRGQAIAEKQKAS